MRAAYRYLLRRASPFQGALAAPLQRFHPERLIQGRPVPVGEQAVVSTARDEHKSRVAGGKRISNRRDGPALEIGVEYCKIEIGFSSSPPMPHRQSRPRQRRYNPISDNISAISIRIISASSTTRSLAGFAGCASVATLHPRLVRATCGRARTRKVTLHVSGQRREIEARLGSQRGHRLQL